MHFFRRFWCKLDVFTRKTPQVFCLTFTCDFFYSVLLLHIFRHYETVFIYGKPIEQQVYFFLWTILWNIQMSLFLINFVFSEFTASSASSTDQRTMHSCRSSADHVKAPGLKRDGMDKTITCATVTVLVRINKRSLGEDVKARTNCVKRRRTCRGTDSPHVLLRWEETYNMIVALHFCIETRLHYLYQETKDGTEAAQLLSSLFTCDVRSRRIYFFFPKRNNFISPIDFLIYFPQKKSFFFPNRFSTRLVRADWSKI